MIYISHSKETGTSPKHGCDRGGLLHIKRGTKDVNRIKLTEEFPFLSITRGRSHLVLHSWLVHQVGFPGTREALLL